MTALSGELTVFGMSDAAITPMTADSSGGVTYGTTARVPGIQNIGLDPEMLNKTLYGPDGAMLDNYAKTRGINFSVTHGRISLPVLGSLLGSTYSTAGSTPNRTATLAMNGGDVPGYFKLEGQILYNGELIGGDTHPLFYKCKIKKWKIEFKNEDYAIISFDAVAFPRIYDGKLLDFVSNETLVNLSITAADTTPPTVSSVSPANSATGVSAAGSITWTLSENLMPSTVNSDSVLLLLQSTGAPVTLTSITLTNNGSSTTIVAAYTGLAGTSVYLAVLTTEVADAAGNKLASAYYSKFTTT